MANNDKIERNLNGSEAIAEAIFQEMQQDDNTILIGEDVGKCGGVFGASRNCFSEFGENRVRDMPISEMTFTGMGVGMAMSGLRPIIEIMFADFLGVCLEQIYNAIGKIHYMSGGTVKMPIVVKTAAGNIGSAAQHSQCLWGTLAHLPGLKIVVPSSLYDHKGLMASAIRSNDPVIFFEHKELLLKRARSFLSNPIVPKKTYTVPIGKAVKPRIGSDITLVTLSYSVELALESAAEVAKEGIDVEIIDLRSLVPLDIETVLQSVRKTQRLLVVDEDYQSFGVSGEIITRVVENIEPTSLKQIKRHAVPDVPIPAALSLEQVVVPNYESIKNMLIMMAKGS